MAIMRFATPVGALTLVYAAMVFVVLLSTGYTLSGVGLTLAGIVLVIQ